MQSSSKAVADRPHPRAAEVLALMLSQGDLQPHMRMPGPDTRRVSSTCRTLRPHHPIERLGPDAARLIYMDRMLARRPAERGQFRDALRRCHDEAVHGPLPQLLDDCRDTVWMADAWHGHAPRDRQVPEVGAERRRTCLAYLWAVRFDGSLEEGDRAVERARAADPERLFALLATDAAEAAATVAAMGLALGAGATAAAWFGSAASNAWKAGTAGGKAKAIAAGAGAAGSVLFGVSFAVTFGALGYQLNRFRRQEREHVLATQYGRDALFCELVTQRRTRRVRGEL